MKPPRRLPSDFSVNAAYPLYAIDPAKDRAWVLHFDREDYRRATFLDERANPVAPARFRIEMQAHRALLLIEDTDAPLARIAAECGFADQPHLTRSIVQITGHPPAYWRRQSIPFNTDRAYRR